MIIIRPHYSYIIKSTSKSNYALVLNDEESLPSGIEFKRISKLNKKYEFRNQNGLLQIRMMNNVWIGKMMADFDFKTIRHISKLLEKFVVNIKGNQREWLEYYNEIANYNQCLDVDFLVKIFKGYEGTPTPTTWRKVEKIQTFISEHYHHLNINPKVGLILDGQVIKIPYLSRKATLGFMMIADSEWVKKFETMAESIILAKL